VVISVSEEHIASIFTNLSDYSNPEDHIHEEFLLTLRIPAALITSLAETPV
jgi:hypothetical protein